MVTFHSVRTIRASDVSFAEAKQLRYKVLFEPFGISALRDHDDGNPDSTHVVVTDNGKVVGYGRLVRRGDEAQIRHVCVDPAAQGQGVGTELVEALVDIARKGSAKTVFLNARFTALGMYRRFGFTEVGGLIQAEDVAVPHKRMELKL